MKQHPWLTTQLLIARHGLAWPIVLLIALLLAWAQFAWLPSRFERLREEAGRLADLRRSASHVSPAHPNKEPPERLRAFEAALLPREELKRFLVDAWDGASVHAVRVTRTEYRIERESRGGFNRLLITVPAAGRYPDIRAYAMDLLIRYPGLALDKLQIKRELSASAEVEAELDLVLLMRVEG